jgi:hypothetical protein
MRWHDVTGIHVVQALYVPSYNLYVFLNLYTWINKTEEKNNENATVVEQHKTLFVFPIS